MSKFASFLAEEKNEFSSMLSVSMEQSDSQFFSLNTNHQNPEVEYLGWGEKQKPIGTLQDSDRESIPVLNLHLDSKEAIAIQELGALLESMNKAGYFADDKQLILLGDLNINLADQKDRKKLADIFEQNALSVEKSVLEAPIERERCIDIALNQQPHKGGLKKTDVKNAIFLLRRKQLADASALEKLDSAYESLPAPQKIGADGLDHNPVALQYNNTLYVSVSNLPTQPGGKVSTQDVIMTPEARNTDLNLRDFMRKTLETTFNIQVDDLTKFAKPLNAVLRKERENAASMKDFALFLANKMNLFINTVIHSEAFFEYEKNRVTREFAEKNLSTSILGDFFKNPGNIYTTEFDVFADLNPNHRVSKAIRQIVVDDKADAMKVERLLTNFFEMISPQPNNGYEPAALSPKDMEALRIDIIHHLILQYAEVNQVKIFCNDTIEKDYHSFRFMLAEMIAKHEKSMIARSISLPIQEESAENNAASKERQRTSFLSAFFKRIKVPCCAANEDIEAKHSIANRK